MVFRGVWPEIGRILVSQGPDRHVESHQIATHLRPSHLSLVVLYQIYNGGNGQPAMALETGKLTSDMGRKSVYM